MHMSYLLVALDNDRMKEVIIKKPEVNTCFQIELFLGNRCTRRKTSFNAN